MNSRNHAMFAGPGSWLHTYVGGITNAPGSIGYEHVSFAPPATLISSAYATLAAAVTAPAPAPAPATYSSYSTTTSAIISRDYQKKDGSTVSSMASNTDRAARMAAAASDPLRWGSATKVTGRGTFGLFWSFSPAADVNQTCGTGNESASVAVNCTGVGINEVVFADYGMPVGTFEDDCGNKVKKGNCTTASLAQQVSSVCIGADSCVLECTAHVAASEFMGCNISAVFPGGSTKMVGMPLPDPCNGKRKKVALQVQCNGPALSIRSTVPGNSAATTAVPLLGTNARDVSVSENGTTVWGNGAFVPGARGVSAAVVSNGAIVVTHGSGVYDFRRTSKLY
jgi:hypothetical protein